MADIFYFSGEDKEAAARRDRLKAEFDQAKRFLDLLRD